MYHHASIPQVTPQPLKSWLFFSPLYFALVGMAYYVAATIFPKTLDIAKYFGISFGKEQVFNQLLFLHLTIMIGIFATIHLFSVSRGHHFTIGRYLLTMLLLLAMTLFVLGINLPLLSTTKFYFFKENYSLIDILSNLKSKNEQLLYGVMLAFTFVVPIVKKMALAYEIFLAKSTDSKNTFLNLLSKWAMADVLVIAIVIACMKSSSGVVEMSTSNGLVYFAASVLCSLIISTILPFIKLR